MILKLILIVLLGFLAIRLYRYFTAPAKKITPDPINKKRVEGMDLVEDPICHTYFPLDSAYKKILNDEGKSVYFCSAACFNKYKEKTKREES